MSNISEIHVPLFFDDLKGPPAWRIKQWQLRRSRPTHLGAMEDRFSGDTAMEVGL